MGLDMYLSKHIYVKNWDHMKPEDKYSITIKKGGKKFDGVNTKKIKYIIEEAGYWRKANAIHNWFVENVQNGEDDCGYYYVTNDHMKELIAVIDKVLAASKLVKSKISNGQRTNEKGEWEEILVDGETIEDPTVAQELLPTTRGFFFGSTDYDQYYIEDLKYTKKILEEALKDNDGEFYYHSSW